MTPAANSEEEEEEVQDRSRRRDLLCVWAMGPAAEEEEETMQETRRYEYISLGRGSRNERRAGAGVTSSAAPVQEGAMTLDKDEIMDRGGEYYRAKSR